MVVDLSIFESLGLVQILLWLLSFAIVYGILDQLKLPNQKGARAIIALVIAFMVLFAAPNNLINIISTMSTGLLLLILAIIIFMIFIETAGVKRRAVVAKDNRGRNIHSHEEGKNIFEAYGRYFAIAFFIIAAMIFIGAGGLNLLGWGITLSESSIMSLGFLLIIVLAIMWLVANPDKKD